MPIDLGNWPLPVNAALFVAGAVIIWFAGSRLARAADRVAGATGLSHAFVGLLLLGVVTSLPEVVSTVVTSTAGEAALAMNNLFGGISFQTAILAVADASAAHRPLTYFAHRSEILLQGLLLVLMLGIAAASLTIGGAVTLGWVSPWTLGLGLIYIVAVWLLRRYQGQEEWHADPRPEEEELAREPSPEVRDVGPRLGLEVAGTAAVILVAGVVVATTSDVLAEQTGIGSSFAGVVLLAAATSMPELSTTIAAARQGNNSMAISNIFGTNLFTIGLLALSDAAYVDGPVIAEAGNFASFAIALAVVLTLIYLVGIVQRSGRSVWKVGLDSFVVLVVYAGGIIILYQLR